MMGEFNSLIDTEMRNGPKFEPYGTPDVTLQWLDLKPSKFKLTN